MNQQTVEFGKIITILFDGPFSKPLKIAIYNKDLTKKTAVVYISPRTPLAKAIYRHKLGEKIKFNTSEGKLQIRILKISN